MDLSLANQVLQNRLLKTNWYDDDLFNQVINLSNLLQDENEKKKIREDINSLEVEVRTLRDQLADRLTENKNLEILIKHENDLAEEKARLEERSLNMCLKDLEQ